MKRDPSLAQLSRDHHAALVVAQLLKRASGGIAEEAADAFLRYWESDGREHFREEEEVLLPTFARFADPDLPVVTRVLIDHVRIRRAATELASGAAGPEQLHMLGKLLEAHVRCEERELFPLIEKAVPAPELARLASLLGHWPGLGVGATGSQVPRFDWRRAMANVTETRTNAGSEDSVAELVKQLSEQTSRLARQEVELAKAELAVKGKRAGLGAGMFGGAGIFGFYAVGALTATAILGLATAVAAWLAALIITCVLGALASGLALFGKTKVQQATPPVPEQATESVKEDVQWAKTRARAGRQ